MDKDDLVLLEYRSLRKNKEPAYAGSLFSGCSNCTTI
jgi:hypothetical protein